MFTDQNPVTSFAKAQSLRLLSSALSSALTLVDALDTTFISGLLSNIGAHITRADAALLAVASIFTLFLVARLMEDRRRLLHVSQMVPPRAAQSFFTQTKET